MPCGVVGGMLPRVRGLCMLVDRREVGGGDGDQLFCDVVFEGYSFFEDFHGTGFVGGHVINYVYNRVSSEGFETG